MHLVPSPPSPPDDDLECVVFDLPARPPGFYSHGFRIFYVASDGAIYLVRTPGQRATLQQVDDLPDGSHSDAPHDRVLRHLAAAAEAAGCRPAPRGRPS